MTMEYYFSIVCSLLKHSPNTVDILFLYKKITVLSWHTAVIILTVTHKEDLSSENINLMQEKNTFSNL